jgi:hypothetical protein
LLADPAMPLIGILCLALLPAIPRVIMKGSRSDAGSKGSGVPWLRFMPVAEP